MIDTTPSPGTIRAKVGSRPISPPPERECPRSAEHGVVTPHDRRVSEPNPPEALKQYLECDHCLEPSELGTEAVVNAVAERERSTVVTCQIEPVGIAELLRVAVTRSEEEYKLLPTSNPLAAQLVVL